MRRDQRVRALSALWQALTQLEGAATGDEAELLARLRAQWAALQEASDPAAQPTVERRPAD